MILEFLHVLTPALLKEKMIVVMEFPIPSLKIKLLSKLKCIFLLVLKSEVKWEVKKRTLNALSLFCVFIIWVLFPIPSLTHSGYYPWSSQVIKRLCKNQIWQSKPQSEGESMKGGYIFQMPLLFLGCCVLDIVPQWSMH